MITLVSVLLASLVIALVALGWSLNVIDENEKEITVINNRVKRMEELLNEDHA